MISKMYQMIRAAVVTRAVGDNTKYPQTQVQSKGTVSNCETIYPYGHHAVAPNGSRVILMTLQGSEDQKTGIPYSADDRPKGLRPSEAVFGNFVQGSIIHFKENGDIDILSQNDTNITIRGKATANFEGGATIKGDVKFEGRVDFTTEIYSSDVNIGKDHQHLKSTFGNITSGVQK